jgi:acyl dehydratase
VSKGIARVAEGPYFDELRVGQRFTNAPAITITDGLVSARQAIVGERLRLCLDRNLAQRVVGGPLAPPALVWDLAIGQSTIATHHVRANLFYRGLNFRSAPLIGDTLHTVTEVIGLRQNRAKAGRNATGVAALQITTVDQVGRPILEFVRCAMLPLREPSGDTGHRDDLDAISPSTAPDYGWLAETWQLDDWAESSGRPGDTWAVKGGDVVSSAPELARLTLNVAQVHHDWRAGGGQRLVYGGHTIGIALTQVTRALPELVTVAGWHSCDHLAPVYEGDTLQSSVEFESEEVFGHAMRLAHLRSRVRATAPGEDTPRDVLDWRFDAVLR